MVHPLPSPVPPSPETSRALTNAFAEHRIRFLPNRRVTALDAADPNGDILAAAPVSRTLTVQSNAAAVPALPGVGLLALAGLLTAAGALALSRAARRRRGS